jgi:hypothetical protein
MLDVLEVVNSPVESPKCVDERNEQEPKAPTQNSRNRTIRHCSGPTAVRGAAGLRRIAPPPAK